MEWPIIFKCNNNCISCILDSRIRDKMGTPFLGQIKEVIDKSKPKDNTLSFTGGEPTLRKEFFQILEYTRKKHPDMFLFVVSNGRMFAYKNFTKRLANLKLKNFRLGIAIYSHDPKIHDSITQVNGSLKETFQGMKNLLKNKMRVELRIIVNKTNYKTMEETTKFIVKNFKGIERVIFINMKYTGNAFINREKVFVRYPELVPYIQKAVDFLLENNFEVKLFHFPLCTIDRKYWDLAKGTTKQEVELTLLEKCNECTVREECPKIWKTYLTLGGGEEFKPIIDKRTK